MHWHLRLTAFVVVLTLVGLVLASPAETTPVSGRVVDPQGRAVPGAAVFVVYDAATAGFVPADVRLDRRGKEDGPPDDEWHERVVTTDVDGRWSVDVPAGHAAWVNAAAPARGLAPGVDHEVESGGEIVLRLPLGVSLTGVVVDATGEPVAGAVMRLQPARHDGVDYGHLAMLAHTDDAGRFKLPPVRPGEAWLVAASAEGHASGFARRFVDSEDDTPLRLVLGRDEPLVGRVVGPEGQPVGRARIWTTSAPAFGNALAREAYTDEDGHFAVRGVPGGPLVVTVTAVEYGDVRPGLRHAGDELHVTLPRRTRVRGRVTDAVTGRPVERFRVSPGWTAAVLIQPNFATTSASQWFEDGEFDLVVRDFGDVPREHVLIEAPGYRPVMSPVLQKGHAGRFDVALEPAEDVHGTLVCPDGEASAGVPVVVLGYASRGTVFGGDGLLLRDDLLHVVTDADGRFSLPPARGRYRLAVQDPRGFVDADFAAEDARLDLRLGRHARLELRLPAGLEGELRVSSHTSEVDDGRRGEAGFSGTFHVGKDRMLTLDRLPAAGGRPVAIRLADAAGRTVTVAADLHAGRTTRLDLEEASLTLRGRLPVDAGVRVTLYPRAADGPRPADADDALRRLGRLHAGTTDADGRFTMPGVLPGRYVLQAVFSGESWRELVTDVDVAGGQAETDLGDVDAGPPVDLRAADRLDGHLGHDLDNGSRVGAGDLRGRPVVLLVFSGCDGNSAAMGDVFAQLAEDARREGQVPVALAADRVTCGVGGIAVPPAELVTDAWHRLYLDVADGGVLSRLGVTVMPTVLHVDAAGTIVERRVLTP